LKTIGYGITVAALLGSTASFAACPTANKAFSNKTYQGGVEVYSSEGNLVGSWTLSQKFNATGDVAQGKVFMPDIPGEGLAFQATTISLDKTALGCGAEVRVTSDIFNHSGRAVFQESGAAFEYAGVSEDGRKVRVFATRQTKCAAAKDFINKAFACEFQHLDEAGNLITAFTGTQVFGRDSTISRARAFPVGQDRVFAEFNVVSSDYDSETCTGKAITMSDDGSVNGEGTFTMIPGKVTGWDYVGSLPNGHIAKSSCRAQ
jgi:hypothetical protein